MVYSSVAIPLEKIVDPEIASFDIDLSILRIDKVHPLISGNKWFKLKYNIEEFRKQNREAVLTFGGAFSNHIAATAAAGKEFGFRTIGIIRGEEIFPLNSTLQFATDCGMLLHYISREQYRKKDSVEYIDWLHRQFGDFFLLPEGGTNELAVKGCAEILSNVTTSFDYVCCAVGTGGTFTGLISSLKQPQKAIGFSVLKDGAFLKDEVRKLLKCIPDYSDSGNWDIITDYHFGGYAKVNDNLVSFVNTFRLKHTVPLDYIYTGKMMYGVYAMIKKGYFPKKSKIITVHTGGLQGNSAIVSRYLN